ncbi:MAG: ECF transporter S component [Halanaerobiales bacterium]
MNDIKKELHNLQINNLSVRSLSYLALFIAAVALATFIKVPGLNTSYYNLGEVFIFTIAIVFGRKAGAISGAIGAALMDLLLFPVWAPFTLIIKGLEGWVVGKIAEGGSLTSKIIAVVIGGHIMIVGYALTTWYLYDWPSVLPEIGGNYGQAAVGALIAIPLAGQINKILKR